MKQRYDSYKPSGIDWIGEIPSHWEKCRIKDCFYLKTGTTPKGFDKSFNDEGVNWFTPSDIDSCGTILASAERKLSKGLIDKEGISLYPRNSLIFVGIGATAGKLGYAEVEGYSNQQITALIPKDICSKYYFYYLCQDSKRVRENASYTTLPIINNAYLSQVYWLRPPYSEQESIATWLDEKCSEIDAAIAKVDREIELIDELKQSEISRVVTRGLNPDVPLKPSGIDWIGEVPEHWECIKIKHLSPVYRGASPRPIDNPIYFDDNGEFAWVRIADVTASDRYLTSTTQRLSELGASLSVKRYPGDFFLSIAGTVGKPIISKIKCCIHDGFVWFPFLKINPEFLYYIFMTGQPYKGLGKFGTQLNLNTDTVGNIIIPLPSPQEIDQIIDYLDKKCAEIDGLKEKLVKKRETLKELRQSIISEVVTGKRKVI